MQIATHWQPAYALPSAPVRQRKSRAVHRRAYMFYGRSRTAQKILRVIEQHKGISAGEVVAKTRLSGAGAYIKTLEADGYVICKLQRVPGVHQRIKHYWPNHD